MGLKEYRAKRNFSKTPEPPESGEKRTDGGLIYVIQKHDASRLHYDLRLEENGVLTSWAIPKIPPLKEGEKRLAVRTEDHPIEYAGFEGAISEGTYGAGTVEIWDNGTYEPVEMTAQKKIVDIHGGKLAGRYALIKLKPREKEKGVNWLFFKTK